MKYSNSHRSNRAYASSGTKLDAVERRFVRLFDTISYAHPIIKFRLWVAGRRGGDSVVAPAPSAIIDAIVSKAIDGLVDWGGGVTGIQCPDCFEVQVPTSAWRMYYGHGAAEICARIEAAVQAKLHRKFGFDSLPHVSICPTMALLDGELIVKASYFDTPSERTDAPAVEPQWGRGAAACDVEAAGAAATVRLDGRASAPTVDAVDEARDACDEVTGDVAAAVADAGDAHDGGEANVEDTPGEDVQTAKQDVLEAPSLTPCLMTMAPAGTLAFGRRRYPLRDGMTVGVKRGDGPEQADIMLPYSEDFYLVSRRHGRLAYDAAQGAWHFEQLGPNGTTVVRDGRIVATLERGDSAVLRDGDGLLFAGARQQVSFLLLSEGRTVCLGAA
ncbi:hypothetical protein QUW40_08565 [Collinsella tanakaei]|uniref:hypothetical protein n=1 Tax=Collinsella tanakaei TaxID=626935 RepID=UPI0025A48A00|nr:hypothetical protein [Collinsella tanakaei]MDM8246650.1 hypothetical protein [Collinsella tanakaei]